MFPKSNMAGMLQQAKQMQERIEALQGELKSLRLEGQAGGGMVTAVVNGQQELLSLQIAPELFTEDRELVEDLIVAAVRQALEKSRDEAQRKMGTVAGGMLGNLPFPGV